MPTLDPFINQHYLNLETRRKNGQPMPTPVWFVQDGNMLYVRTMRDSGKVKRARNNPQVRIMPCGRAGEPLGEWISARAREVTDSAVYERVRALLWEKYGPMVGQFEARARESGLEYTILEITVE